MRKIGASSKNWNNIKRTVNTVRSQFDLIKHFYDFFRDASELTSVGEVEEIGRGGWGLTFYDTIVADFACFYLRIIRQSLTFQDSQDGMSLNLYADDHTNSSTPPPHHHAG